MEFNLIKNIWTEEDFESMNWHDNPVHGISFTNDFQMQIDIDYIFEWVLKGKKYKFWISPCTLVFDNVYDLVFEIGPSSPGFTIDFITKNNPQKPKNSEDIKRGVEFDWTINMQEGAIAFKSVGYRQYARKLPQLLNSQKIDLKDRGGISFEIITI